MPDEETLATVSVAGTDLPEVVDFDVRSDLGDYSIFDAFTDVFTPPQHHTIHRPNTGRVALVLDGFRIRRDFERAFAALDREHPASD